MLLVAVGLAPTLAAAADSETRFGAVAVAVRTANGTRLPEPTREKPMAYIAFDAGYLESGAAVAGDAPPSPRRVAAGLRAALASQNYRPAVGQEMPAVALLLHWGVLRVATPLRSSFGSLPDGSKDANFHNRVNLIAPPRTARAIIDDMLGHAAGQHSLRNLFDDWTVVKQLANDDRYFLIVTAYSWPDLVRGRVVALWRTRLSASANSEYMALVIPSLARGAGGYLARTLSTTQITHVEMDFWHADPLADAQRPFAAPKRLVGAAREKLLIELARREQRQFTGDVRSPSTEQEWLDAPSDSAQRALARVPAPDCGTAAPDLPETSLVECPNSEPAREGRSG